MVFGATAGEIGFALWRSDGTDGGTQRVLRLNVRGPTGSSSPQDIVVFDDRLYFTASDGSGTRLLYVVDELGDLWPRSRDGRETRGVGYEAERLSERREPRDVRPRAEGPRGQGPSGVSVDVDDHHHVHVHVHDHGCPKTEAETTKRRLITDVLIPLAPAAQRRCRPLFGPNDKTPA